MNYSNSLKRATGACCLCACLCLSGSAAYMTYSTTMQNVITMGSVQIELDVQDGVGQDLGEEAREGSLITTRASKVNGAESTGINVAKSLGTNVEGSTSAPATPSKEVTVLPGTSVPYKVRVQNTGTDAAFVRVKLDCRATPAQFQDFVGLDINYRFWTYQNGFLVYRDLLEPGQLTEPLFTTISFSPEYSGLADDVGLPGGAGLAGDAGLAGGVGSFIDAGLPGASSLPNASSSSNVLNLSGTDARAQVTSNPSCTVSVTAYAVQAANNAPSPLLAFGWPKEQS